MRSRRRDIKNPNKPKYKGSFEPGVARNLTKRGIAFDYEPHAIVYWKKLPNSKCNHCGSKEVHERHRYTPDFYLKDYGLYIETKGKFTSTMRTKMLAVKESNPELNIKFLFMKDNWITKNHKHRYSDWCEQNGFDYAFMKVPDEWLRGD